MPKASPAGLIVTLAPPRCVLKGCVGHDVRKTAVLNGYSSEWYIPRLGGSEMTNKPFMFHRLAQYYDQLVGEKDYRAECRRLESLARRYGRSGGGSWLDVACGTGRHLELLRHEHPTVGIDISPEMLEVARRRLRGIRLVHADMRDFELGKTFDVVSCLYSAIGHLRSERELQATFANFARHLKPGGVAIVEPWIDPSDFKRGYIHVLSYKAGDVTVARMGYSFSRGAHSFIRYHYLIGVAGRGVQHLEETDVGLLVPHKHLRKLMAQAGLRARVVRPGLTPGRGLLIGQKPTV